jgi:hypothetical protein
LPHRRQWNPAFAGTTIKDMGKPQASRIWLED